MFPQSFPGWASLEAVGTASARMGNVLGLNMVKDMALGHTVIVTVCTLKNLLVRIIQHFRANFLIQRLKT